jgi:hypothetical protein
MALSFAHGVLTWATADTVGTVKTVSGLAFQPKALMVMTMGLSSGVDATSEATHACISLGFGASTTDRRCVSVQDTDAAGAADTSSNHRNDAIAAILSATALDGRLDLNSITSDGFTLIVDDQSTRQNLSVFWFAWGGSDITAVETLDIAEPAATGLVNYGTFAPDVVFFAGCAANVVNGYRDESPSICFGAATGLEGGSITQWVFSANSDFGSTTMDTDRYGYTGDCAALIALAGAANLDCRAQFFGRNMAFNWFSLNWAKVNATAARRFIALSMQGGQWAVDSILSDSATVTVSGLAFQPQGAIWSTHGTIAQAADTTTTQGALCIGGFSSTTDRRGMGYLTEDATANAEVDLAIDYDQVLVYPSNAGGVDTALDVGAINSDGFTVVRDAGTTNMLVGFVTWADAAAAPAFMPRPPYQVNQSVNRASTF